LAQLNEESNTETVLRGAFKDSKSPGVFVGSFLPQHNKHYYTVRDSPNNIIKFDCITFFTAGQGRLKELKSETTWVCAKKNLNNSIASYAAHIPVNKAIKAPPVGWNSWDYYYSSVSAADIVENMDAIQSDKVLSQKIKYILIDMGWAEQEGEWYPNHRFPGGTKKIAKEIKERGFIPGIWTAPLWVNALSPMVLRKPHMLIQNEYGDPQSIGGRYVLDPTHPESKEYLRELYTRLYDEGFRVYKIDFLDVVTEAYSFYHAQVGYYEAIREMYGVIRSCIKDSHMFAATAFPECGPGILDSGRLSIDIHNQWSHLKWGMEAIQLKMWMHKRLFYIDPDFIVVRGESTTTETETNVTDPVKNAPDHPRWRSGPTFTFTEAQTHVNIIALTGGSVVLSDRISKLTKEGLELVYKVIDAPEVPAKALDLGDDTVASIWYQDLGREKRLTVINWDDKEVVKPVLVREYGIKLPGKIKDSWSGETLLTKDGQFTIPLKAHQSKVYIWS
jgi:alpha-galactosidase